MDIKKIIQKLLDLQNAYATVHRGMVTSERLKNSLLISSNIDVEDIKNREPLIEHIGYYL